MIWQLWCVLAAAAAVQQQLFLTIRPAFASEPVRAKSNSWRLKLFQFLLPFKCLISRTDEAEQTGLPSRLLQKTNYFLRESHKGANKGPRVKSPPCSDSSIWPSSTDSTPTNRSQRNNLQLFVLGFTLRSLLLTNRYFCFSSWRDQVQVCYHSLAEGCGGCKLWQLRAAYTVITPFDLLPTFTTACLFCRNSRRSWKIHKKSATRPRFCYQTYLGRNAFCHMWWTRTQPVSLLQGNAG